jgi:hypothetical protein
MNRAVTQSTLERLGHKFDPLRVFEEVRLRRCRGCGRIWRFKAADNSIDAVTYLWLKLLEPTGWTMTFDLPFEPRLDEVSLLSPIEVLLWNAEPCPGPPTRDYPGAIENAAYRLIALGVLDASSAKLAMKGILPSFSALSSPGAGVTPAAGSVKPTAGFHIL